MRSAKPVIVPREESINAQKQSIQYRLVAHVCTPATASRAPIMRSTYAHTMFALIRVTLQGILATHRLDVPMRARTERLPGVLVVQEANGTQWQFEGNCLHTEQFVVAAVAAVAALLLLLLLLLGFPC